MLNRVISIVLIVIWMFAIYQLSAEDAGNSNRWSRMIAEEVIRISNLGNTPGAERTGTSAAAGEKEGKTADDKARSKESLLVFNLYIRKLAHFIEYFVLALLCANILSMNKALRSNIWCLCVIVFAFCVLFAVSDELHQYFSSGRDSRVTDVLIDSAGAALGLLVWRIAGSKLKRIKTG